MYGYGKLSGQKDIESINSVASCGVKILASVHANSIDDLKQKKEFQELINKKVFKRYVVLGLSRGLGTIEGVYDENFRCIYV